MKPTVGIAVDGSSLGNPGRGQYQLVDLETGTVLYCSPIFDDATNNQMEFVAVVHAIGYCKHHKINIPIYSDSQTARAWVKKRHCGSSHLTSSNQTQMIVDRAECFVEDEETLPEIQTWFTREWGEVPSDFGYKAGK